MSEQQITGVKIEPCSRCGQYNRLVKLETDKGYIWMQPVEHVCGTEYLEQQEWKQ